MISMAEIYVYNKSKHNNMGNRNNIHSFTAWYSKLPVVWAMARKKVNIILNT